jgi:hypothetical protein
MRSTIIFILLLIALFGEAHAQKGETSIAAGPLLSFPLGDESANGKSDLKPGIGLEAMGQYNLSDRSALLLKVTFASWSYKDSLQYYYDRKRLTLFTPQAGYRYQFGQSGFFLNGLVGVDIDFHDAFVSGSFTFGGGKRFMMNESRFIDVGVDLIGADGPTRLNIKGLFSLFQ